MTDLCRHTGAYKSLDSVLDEVCHDQDLQRYDLSGETRSEIFEIVNIAQTKTYLKESYERKKADNVCTSPSCKEPPAKGGLCCSRHREANRAREAKRRVPIY